MAKMRLDPAFFVAWRQRNALTQAKVVEITGQNISTIKKWEAGTRSIPPYIGFVMAAIENGLQPLGQEAMIPVEKEDGD